MMDAYLTADAVRTLGAVRRLAKAAGARGFLLGHRRGDRIYVESALPSPANTWPSLDSFYQLDAELGGKIVGFFLFRAAAADRKSLLRPFGTGKVLIEIGTRVRSKADFRGALIDYRDGFEFRIVSVIAERPDR